MIKEGVAHRNGLSEHLVRVAANTERHWNRLVTRTGAERCQDDAQMLF